MQESNAADLTQEDLDRTHASIRLPDPKLDKALEEQWVEPVIKTLVVPIVYKEPRYMIRNRVERRQLEQYLLSIAKTSIRKHVNQIVQGQKSDRGRSNTTTGEVQS
jgi:hypothetical protein